MNLDPLISHTNLPDLDTLISDVHNHTQDLCFSVWLRYWSQTSQAYTHTSDIHSDTSHIHKHAYLRQTYLRYTWHLKYLGHTHLPVNLQQTHILLSFFYIQTSRTSNYNTDRHTDLRLSVYLAIYSIFYINWRTYCNFNALTTILHFVFHCKFKGEQILNCGLFKARYDFKKTKITKKERSYEVDQIDNIHYLLLTLAFYYSEFTS